MSRRVSDPWAGRAGGQDALDRAEFLRRSVAGGAGVLAVPRLLSTAEALAATVTAPDVVQRFRSRPDLRPPVVTVTRAASKTSGGYIFIAPSSGPGQRGTMIMDEEGELVWWHPTTPVTAMNFRPAVWKGKPVLAWWQGKANRGLGQGEYVVLDGSYRTLARFSTRGRKNDDLHELLLTPRGTALVSVNDIRPMDLTPYKGRAKGSIVGGVVRELAIPSGRVLFEWNSLDDVDLDESYARPGGNGSRFDYFHINSIDVAPDGNLLVSARHTWAVYKVDIRTGELIWRLGGKRSDFTMGRGTNFEWQHDVRSHGPSRITIFDNAAAPKKEPQTRILLVELDVAGKRARLVRQWKHPRRLLSKFMGNAQVLSNGNVFVGWGSEPYVTEFGPQGAVRFDARLPKGGQNYRAFRFPWSGHPAEPPAAALRLVDNRRVLYASWNGSTEVESWRVEWGAGPDLRDSVVHPKRGFETGIELPATARYAAAVAVDRRGRPLARSAKTRLRR